MPALAATVLDRPKARISAAEAARRRVAVEKAHATNRIEGIAPNPAAEPIFDAFVRGDLTLAQMGEAIDRLPR